jgi:hypothetical protein
MLFLRTQQTNRPTYFGIHGLMHFIIRFPQETAERYIMKKIRKEHEVDYVLHVYFEFGFVQLIDNQYVFTHLIH